jgi:hypothetical protein
MTYVHFRDAIRAELRKSPEGKTWKELRQQLALPYGRPCPEWVKALEKEIGLSRKDYRGRELLWRLGR